MEPNCRHSSGEPFNDNTYFKVPSFNYCRKKPPFCILELLTWPKFQMKMKSVQTKCSVLPISKHPGLCVKIKLYKNRPQRLKIKQISSSPVKNEGHDINAERVEISKGTEMCSGAQSEKQDV